MSKKLLFALLIFTSFLFLTSFSPRQTFALDCSNPANILQEMVCNSTGDLLNTAIGLGTEHLGKFLMEIVHHLANLILFTLAGDVDSVAGGTAYQYQGLTNTVGAIMFETVSHPPQVNHLAFIKYNLANNVFSQPVYAETGASYLRPISNLWNRFRDIAYGLFVVAIALVALGLMMRTQISPRVTITLANSLPRLFLALFLITFSYSIIGLIIDLAAVLKGLIDNIFIGSAVTNPITGQPLLPGDWETHLVIGTALVGTIVGNAIDTIRAFSTAVGPPGFLIGVILAIIFAIATFIVFIKLFFVVAIRWAGIFVAVILSPLALFWSAIPGQEALAIKLLKSVMVSALTFPAIYFLILLAVSISAMGVTDPITAPDTWGFAPFSALMGTGVSFSLNSFVSLGILFTATKVPDVLEDALNLRPIFKGGGGPAEAFRRVPLIGGLLK